MSAPDFHAMAARHVYGLPDEWEPRIYRVLGDARVTIGYSLTGAVPVGVITRGPRKGKPKWPPRNQLREVIITPADLAAATAQWVATTGLCPKCGGEGRIAWRVSAANGTEYRPCKACGGTGKAPVPSDEREESLQQAWGDMTTGQALEGLARLADEPTTTKDQP
jgi:hypothetical protein